MTLFVPFLIVVIGLFVLGWLTIPKGALTKITARIGSGLTGIYYTLQDQMHLLQQIVPPEFAVYVFGGFLALLVAASIRPESHVKAGK